MAENKEQRERLQAKRFRALALMHLTRRDDLEIVEEDQDVGLDLTVRIRNGERSGLRQFGVVVRGLWESVPKERADRVLGRLVSAAQKHGPFPFPVCLFLFTMDESTGWYSWVTEPIVADGKATLHAHHSATSKLLDRTALDHIVAAVERWYAGFFSDVVVAENEADRSKARKTKNNG